jgi:hypothetical protein
MGWVWLLVAALYYHPLVTITLISVTITLIGVIIRLRALRASVVRDRHQT